MSSGNYQYQSVQPAGGYNDGYNNYFQEQQRSNKKSKYIVIGTVVGILLLIGIGVGVGVGVATHNKNNRNTSATSNTGSSNSGSSNSSVVSQSDPNDPSTFVKNDALKPSFYGMAYTPYGSQLPDCNNSLADVITDIQLLSQLTTRIRLYGADCNQSALVLEAVKQTKVDMKVYLGIYPVPTDAGEAYVRQRDLVKQALQTYGTDHVAGLTVGNEFILNYLGANGGTGQDPNGSVGNAGAQLLISNITDARNMLKDMGISIPVGNADAGSYFNTELLSAVDYGMANVHPWFASQAVEESAAWTFNFFSETNVAPAAALSNKPTMYIAETGWPTKSSSAEAASDGKSDASIPNLQIFLDTFVCQANQNNVGYFFFEYFDEGWKDVQFGGVEGWWGLFNADRTLKQGITIPDCKAP
ncbi:Glycoside hydrolase family 17 protein [Mycena kentingensis (nom. inval.)]|nr:Glycoside hydrolase family 17 protein [Mycena kentingensis (nom. inval.)]